MSPGIALEISGIDQRAAPPGDRPDIDAEVFGR
jgi:hypothetical protein